MVTMNGRNDVEENGIHAYDLWNTGSVSSAVPTPARPPSASAGLFNLAEAAMIAKLTAIGLEGLGIIPLHGQLVYCEAPFTSSITI
jgi:hypothetical protein